ncbi:hypothetical protein MJO28_003074 [Puccinia striiformis f. sp. tritici]|uniref:Uncharacterized protein n=1 Tax=Puccinia striiformis f. sp. tritici TaxID=168172 RepID=A0ACC0ET89_9BASI|nr:hypothetical protein Pst134EA_005008 [Puccinia striiformis f. sp. tritici]KAH9471100.1 hypothetical protein Pst134EA_005008 [Puccinia striiformis f. sp. tritici]KAI7959283.1 hypothetical protein MJO28_003074 [Puccinia striiformis f. sp. tritici]KAI7965048.1 hypothetical protein MJO29_003146 [Puccinia striiformis f. sp. tritici]
MNRSTVLKRLHVQLVSYQFHNASKLLLTFQNVHGPLQQHAIDVLLTYQRLMMGVRYDLIIRNTSNDDQNYAGEFRMMRRKIQTPGQVRFTVTMAKIAAMDGIIEIARDDRNWTQGNPGAETDLQA